MRKGIVVLAALAALLLLACGKGPEAPARPVDFTRDTVCVLDGMLLSDFPGPKAQIQYGAGAPDFFCDTVEMFAMYLRPELTRPVRGLFVQDMGATGWDEPAGHWIDAKGAFYVHGSQRLGPMGPTLVSFARAEDAAAFAGRYGGKVLPFDRITADMVALDGGVLHDRQMEDGR